MKFTFRRTQTVTVYMADEGEDFEGEPIHYDEPDGQREAALEWCHQAFLDEDYCEEFMEADVSPWEEVDNDR